MPGSAEPAGGTSVLARGAVRGPAKMARSTARRLSIATSGFRVLPDYLIVGTKRGGSTSLHEYLGHHPAIVAPNVIKGSHYFDVQFGRGWAWYRSHFPTVFRRAWMQSRHHLRMVVGEASPYYVFHPRALDRIAAALPSVKLILLARDPVQRAYSHHQYEVARGFESEPIERALDLEPERLAGEEQRMLDDPAYESFHHRHHSYLARGLYIEQVARLWALFPRDQVLVIASEQLFAEPRQALRRVTDFLGLQPFEVTSYEHHKSNRYETMTTAVRRRLAEFFAEPNHRLYDALGVDFGWTTPDA